MNRDFISALREIERERGISTEVLLDALEAALISAYKKNFSTTQNVRVEIDPDQGTIRVFAQKTVAEEVTDEAMEISLEEAREIDPAFQPEDIVENEVTPDTFGRIAAQTAKQVVVQRIREAERNIIFDEFSSRESDIIIGQVQRTEGGNIFVDFGKAEGMLPASEQISRESYRNGERIKVYIVEVKKTNKGPQIIVSRTHPGLIKRLFELEVPEIHDGVVEIKSVSREPGTRSKIAVYAEDENIDPVGACVGQRGSRVQRVVDELGGEKIDIIDWDPDPKEFIANALSPSKVVEIYLLPGENSAKVVVPDNQLSLAIGKEGQNVRLAAKLTGWKIDIKSESQMEEYIEEHGGDEFFLQDEEPINVGLAALMEEERTQQPEEGELSEEDPEVEITLSAGLAALMAGDFDLEPQEEEQPPDPAEADGPEETADVGEEEARENED